MGQRVTYRYYNQNWSHSDRDFLIIQRILLFHIARLFPGFLLLETGLNFEKFSFSKVQSSHKTLRALIESYPWITLKLSGNFTLNFNPYFL